MVVRKEKEKIYIEDENVSLKLDLNELEKKDGMYNVSYIFYSHKENFYEIVTGILDENFNQVIPLKRQTISKKDYDESGSKINLGLFNNKKIIYTVNRESYVLDLNHVLINDEDVPLKYIRKIDFWHNLDGEKIICCVLNKFYLYDVSKDKVLGSVYDNMLPNKNGKLYVYYHGNIGVLMEMDLTGKLSVDATIIDAQGNKLDVFLPNNVMGNKELTLKYCYDCISSINYFGDMGKIQ